MATLRTLIEALDQASRSGSGYTFLSEQGARTRSYAELQDAARRVAGGLRRSGVVPGDVVALVLADAEQFLTTLFGAAIAGGVPALLYPPAAAAALPAFFDSTAATIARSSARAVVTSSSLCAGFEALRGRGSPLQIVLDGDACDADPIDDRTRPALDDIAFVQFTSGSTSSPKGVVLTHRNLAANIDAFHAPHLLATTADDLGVSWLPLFHDMGLVGMSLGALYASRSAVLMTPEMFVKRPIEWLRAIARYRGTVSFAPNFAYDLCVRRVKERDLVDLDLSSWRVAGCGAEPIHAATLDAFAAKFAAAGFRVTSFLPSYGLAEHVLAATFAERGRAPIVQHLDGAALAQRRVAVLAAAADATTVSMVACGRPLPGHALRIVREDGRAAGDHEVGEIALSGPSVMVGYYRDPELTARTIRDGWLFTGDLGYLSNGELFVCGRRKELIVVNGRKYHPQDLEWALDCLPGLRRGRVVAFAATATGAADRVVIVAEPTGTVPAATIDADVRRVIADRFGLAVGEVALVPGGTIGRTTSGKVQRAAVRDLYERGAMAGHPAGLHS
jgi:fatty-acyl-CoA synthase